MNRPFLLTEKRNKPHRSDFFPPQELALTEPDGLLAIGGALSSENLLEAYTNGIFPWYEDNQPVLWWCPKFRAVLRPDKFHVSRSLRRLIKANRYHPSIDQSFNKVVSACAAPRNTSSNTWITADMQQAYGVMHELGYAHSIEIWDDSELVGGLYGISLGSIFFAESMFSFRSNTSKLALYYLTAFLNKFDFELIDCQIINPHLKSLGVVEITRSSFLLELSNAVRKNQSFDIWKESLLTTI
tara:strand:- start:363 stop:1088 length:726 start_codon:yes stop_codon:yes gene_type:complete